MRSVVRRAAWALIACFAFSSAAPGVAAAAGNISLETDFGVRGVLHYCRYNNGQVYAFEAGRECPPSMAEPPDRRGKGMGYLKSESNEGSNKQCVYNVNGMERNMQVATLDNCPLNKEF